MKHASQPPFALLAAAPFQFEPGSGANVRPYQEHPTDRQAVYVRI